MSAHDCPKPPAHKKWRHQLYICDCGKAWHLVTTFTWAGDYEQWVRWKP